jgi:hypothetical protein
VVVTSTLQVLQLALPQLSDAALRLLWEAKLQTWADIAKLDVLSKVITNLQLAAADTAALTELLQPVCHGIVTTIALCSAAF